jgi:hypothetical protein
MFDKFYGIIKRSYYLIAVCIVLGGIFNLTNDMLNWDNNPWTQKSKYNTEIIEKDKIWVENDQGKKFELSVPRWISENDLIKLLNDSPGKTQEELQTAVDSYSGFNPSKFLRDKYQDLISNFYLTLLLVILTLPIARLLHMTGHWIVWGKLK